MVYSQTKTISDLIQTNKEFFTPLRENVYLHLNKTSFFVGERIWFSAYVFDQSNQIPSLATSNLHVALVNAEGMVVKQSLIYIDNGIGSGDFLIDGHMTDKSYYIRAWTNGMKNFKEVLAFKQEIAIIQPNSEFHKKLDGSQVSIQITPEGGQILNDSYNTIEFQLQTAAGPLSEKSSIQLIDSKGRNVVSDIKVNSHQMGTVRFFKQPGEKYKLQVSSGQGISLVTPLPSSTQEGMSMEVNTIHPSFLILTIHCDEKTLEKRKGNAQYLAIRKNGQMQIQEVLLDSTTTAIRIPRGLLMEGISAITLFDSDLNPVSERLIFKEPIDGKSSDFLLSYHRTNPTGDTLLLDLKPGVSLDTSFTASVSVLPYESQAYKPDYNIKSAFLLRPYLKNIGGYYSDFPDQFDREFLYSLDAVLIQNGAGPYPWNTIEGGVPELSFSYEKGIELKGRIPDANLNKENQVWFYTQQIPNWFFADIDRNKKFDLNAIVFAGDSLKVSVFGRKGQLRKPKAEIEIGHSFQHKRFEGVDAEIPGKIDYDLITNEDFFTLDDNTIALDEVVLTENKSSEKDLKIQNAQVSGKIVTDDDIKHYATLSSYLRKLGFKVEITGISTVVVMQNFYPWYPMQIYINGMLSNGTDIFNMPLSRIISVAYDSTKSQGIFITARYSRYEDPDKKNFQVFPVENGYSIPDKYVTPNYPSFQNELFKKYGALYWEPGIQIQKNATTTIKIPIKQQQGLRINIEGMTKEGNLISKKEVIRLEEPPEDN